MLKLLVSVLLLSAIPYVLVAQPGERPARLTCSAIAGYAVEDFNWSIAGTNSMGVPVNILSELEWKKLGGFHIDISAKYRVWKGLMVYAGFSKTFISTGQVSDTDFGSDNKTNVLFHDVFTCNEGYVMRYNAAAGYSIRIFNKHTLTPLAGYGNDSELLYILRNNGNVQGNLRSTYHTSWRGPLTGVDAKIHATKKFAIDLRITYHQADYTASANWNLIDNFKHPVSFRHEAKGYTVAASAGVGYAITKKISVIGSFRYNYSTTGKGSDTLYRSNGVVVVTPLNAVYKHYFATSAGVELGF